MKDFNLGELVTLSASGRERQHNGEVVGLFGMIIRIEKTGEHPYKIQWYGTKPHTKLTCGDEPKMLPMKRYEIKLYRGTVCK